MLYKDINEIQVNKTGSIIVLIKGINIMKMKSGEPYQKVIVRDTNGNEATFLNFDNMLKFEPPTIVRAEIDCTEYGASTAVKIKSCKEEADVPMTAFLPKAQIDIGEYWKKVVKAAKEIRPGLGRILCSMVAAEKNRFISLPLSPIGAYARQGGILEASVKLMEMAETAAAIQNLDRDLMVAGALLYFNGNLDTVDEAYANTVCDLMYGPSVAGSMKLYSCMSNLMADEEAKKDISSNDFMLLNHILVARGRGVDACIPESAALKLLSQMLIETDEMLQAVKNEEERIVINKNNTHRRIYNRAVDEKEKAEE